MFHISKRDRVHGKKRRNRPGSFIIPSDRGGHRGADYEVIK